MRERAAGFALASAVCLWLYWPGLLTWFSMDDFAWLGLRLSVFSVGDLTAALFSPQAQGTIRPLSERMYFLGLEWLFGLEALPFRIVAFIGQLANLWLAMRLVERVTGSRWGGVAAATLWIVNSALALAMSWSSAFNQILWPLFMLAGCHARWTWLTAGSRRARLAEWSFFLLGFGALELQVVYPVIAGALTLLYRRERWRELLPMFAVSAAYTALNRAMVRPHTTSVYTLYWDQSLFSTFGTYLRMATGMWRPELFRESERWWLAGEWVVGLGLAAALSWLAWRRERFAAFGVIWFLATLGPILPLKNHISDYYLTVPVLGLAMAAGLALARRPAWALLPVLVYGVGSGYWAHQTAEYHFNRAEEIRVLVAGVQQAAERHPGKLILLSAVSSEQFWGGINDNPFRLLEGVRVYLAPGAEQTIEKHPELGDPAAFVLPGPAARAAVDAGHALVYSPTGGKLRNVTETWQAMARSRWAGDLATVIQMDQPFLDSQLESGWHGAEHGFRWSKGRAVLRLGAPGEAREIIVDASRGPDSERRAKVTLILRLNGVEAGRWELAEGSTSLSSAAPLPAVLKRTEPVVVEVLVSPVLREAGAGGRELGLAFGQIGFR